MWRIWDKYKKIKKSVNKYFQKNLKLTKENGV